VAGGSLGAEGPKPFEIYDPVGNGQSTILSFPATIGANNSTATALPNGDVLLTGGYLNCTINQRVQMYRFGIDSIVDIGLMSIPRSDHTATLLMNGQVLLTGGVKAGCPTISNTEAELLTP
jgi:hypothetical protein